MPLPDHPAASLIARLLDWILGPRCPDCAHRVFPNDIPAHRALDHAGDPS